MNVLIAGYKDDIQPLKMDLGIPSYRNRILVDGDYFFLYDYDCDPCKLCGTRFDYVFLFGEPDSLELFREIWYRCNHRKIEVI